MGKHNLEGHAPDCDGSCEQVTTRVQAFKVMDEQMETIKTEISGMCTSAKVLLHSVREALLDIRDDPYLTDEPSVLFAMLQIYKHGTDAAAMANATALHGRPSKDKAN